MLKRGDVVVYDIANNVYKSQGSLAVIVHVYGNFVDVQWITVTGIASRLTPTNYHRTCFTKIGHLGENYLDSIRAV